MVHQDLIRSLILNIIITTTDSRFAQLLQMQLLRGVLLCE